MHWQVVCCRRRVLSDHRWCWASSADDALGRTDEACHVFENDGEFVALIRVVAASGDLMRGIIEQPLCLAK